MALGRFFAGWLLASISLTGCSTTTVAVPTTIIVLGADTAPGPRCAADRSWIAVSAGERETCGIHGDGCVECWGEQETIKAVPDGAFSFVAMKGSHVCALDLEGQAVCWGEDDLGWGDTPSGKVSPPDGTFVTLEVDERYSCGIVPGGKIVCWGDVEESPTPTLGGFIQLSGGDFDLCGNNANGYTTCWDPTRDFSYEDRPGRFSTIALGGLDLCALSPEPGPLDCWNIDNLDPWEPTGLQTQDPFVDLCMGPSDTGCALTTEGIARCWGYNSPFPPDGLRFTDIACGMEHACGLTTEGDIACWGLCTFGQCDTPT